MSKDDSSIEDIINNGDFIIIIEDRNYPDDSYYKFLQNKNGEKIIIDINYLKKKRLSLPIDVKIYEMLNAYKLLIGIDDRNYKFLFNGETINPKDETKINEKFRNYSRITCDKLDILMGGFRIKGKKIFAKVIIDGKNIEIKFGTLNSTNDLFELINPLFQ